MTHNTHRDRHHRRRPGRTIHRLPPPAAGPRVRDPRRRRPDRRPVAPAVGHAASSTPPRSTTACPGCPSRRRSGRSPARTRWPTTSSVRRARSSCRSASTPGWRASTRRRRRVRRHHPTGTLTCDNVVVCTGTFGRTPNVPDFAADLDPSILQLHSSEYRRPAQLRDGPVLVVGASHSGTDIAYEVAESHPTILAGRDCGQIPFRIESRAMHVVFPILIFAWKHVLTRRTPMGRKEMPRDPLPRRPDAAGQALRPRGAWRRAARRAGHRCPRRQAGRRRPPGRRRERGLGHRLPAGRSTGSTCRSSARTAGRWRCAAWSTPLLASSSAGCRSSSRSARWCCRASVATPSSSPARSSSAGPGPERLAKVA